MLDIYDIKNIILFTPDLRPETWYTIGLCTTVYLIHIFFLVLSERHRKMRESMMRPDEDMASTYTQQLALISTDDSAFFTRINFLIRSYLEGSGIVKNAIKKTCEEINSQTDSSTLRAILETCTVQEYGLAKSTPAERQATKELA